MILKRAKFSRAKYKWGQGGSSMRKPVSIRNINILCNGIIIRLFNRPTHVFLDCSTLGTLSKKWKNSAINNVRLDG